MSKIRSVIGIALFVIFVMYVMRHGHPVQNPVPVETPQSPSS